MGGSQLIKAIEDAIVNGDEVTAEDLDFTNGKIAEFKELFFGKGKIYEAFPEVEGEGMDAQLRVFVRIPENADDMYMVTGDEEIVFLYVNNGENTISCSTEITRLDDGAEKVKKTNRITVRSYESAFGKEEVNVVTKPEQPTVTGETKVPETATPAEAGKVVETAPVKETTAAEETVSAPEKVTSAPEETTIAPPEIPAQLPEETIADPAESQTESPAEETVKESAESEEITVPESKVSEPVASIIRHNAPIVAVKENGEATKAPEVSEETAAVDPENVRESKETEASTKAEMTQAEITQLRQHRPRQHRLSQRRLKRLNQPRRKRPIQLPKRLLHQKASRYQRRQPQKLRHLQPEQPIWWEWDTAPRPRHIRLQSIS